MAKINYLPGVKPGITINVATEEGFTSLSALEERLTWENEESQFLLEKMKKENMFLRERVESLFEKLQDLSCQKLILEAAGLYDQELIDEYEITLIALTGLFNAQGVALETFEEMEIFMTGELVA